MGFLNVIVNNHLFDRTFVEQWTNAPHLIRTDTGRLLRECDLTPEGSADNFVVWDQARQKPAIWDVSEVAYETPPAIPALSGTFEISMKEGNVVTCRTVWDAFCDEVNKYPLDKVEEITWVPAKEIDEAARLYATSKPAAIQWGVPIDMTPAVTPLCQAIATLWAITGNLDVPGGNVISRYAFDAVAYALPGATGVIKLKNMNQDTLRIGADRYGPFIGSIRTSGGRISTRFLMTFLSPRVSPLSNSRRRAGSFLPMAIPVLLITVTKRGF
jgi:anaerobic selenocysteine-containing dehydrogenase